MRLADTRKTITQACPFFFYIYRMNKIEHICIAVKDLEAANQVYAALL